MRFAADRPLGARASKPNSILVSLLNILRQDKEKTENLNQTGINEISKGILELKAEPQGDCGEYPAFLQQ